MVYREPDPELDERHRAEVAAAEGLENAAALGREAGAAAPPSLRPGAQRWQVGEVLTISGTAVAGAAAAALVAPVAVAAAVGGTAGMIGGAGLVYLGQRLRQRADRRWVGRAPFLVLGYADVLASGEVITGLSTTLDLARVEADDVERLRDLFAGAPGAEVVAVTVEGSRALVECLVPDRRRTLRRCLRYLVDAVGRPLHASRTIRVLRFAAQTSPRAVGVPTP